MKFFNHRAKRGGSLFQGGSDEEEGSRSDPPVGAKPPLCRGEAPFFSAELLRARLRSQVFRGQVVQKMHEFG